ncbi:MAG: hypothetical protein ACLT0Y_03510 [Christensenellales bacterium]
MRKRLLQPVFLWYFEHAEWNGIRILNSDFSHAFSRFTFKQIEWNDALLVGACFAGSRFPPDFSCSRLSAATSQYAGTVRADQRQALNFPTAGACCQRFDNFCSVWFVYTI